MQTLAIQVEKRAGIGKSAARQLRAKNKVPGTLYGLGQETESVTLNKPDLIRALRTNMRRNIVLSLEGGVEGLAMVRQLDVHPTNDGIIHVDLLRIKEDVPVSVNIPLVVVGEAPGVVEQGGAVDRPRRDIKIKVCPNAIPESLEVSIDGLYVGQGVTASGVALPEGMELVTIGMAPVVVIQATRATKTMDDKAVEGEASSEE